MGRTTRWLKALLGGKKEGKVQNTDPSGGGDERREKKRWSFGKPVREAGDFGARVRATTPEEAKWLRSMYAEEEREQSKHAIAVAAATAAAADAAVVAAQAAVAVVRLTSLGRGSMIGVHQRLAAVKIQTVFRGYLARKALRALKALVKLQALVRGNLVRKHATTTFQSVQSLIRAQANSARAGKSSYDGSFRAEISSRRSLERFDDSRSGSFDRSPKIVEIDTCRPRSRSSRRASSPSKFDPGDDPPPLCSISSPAPCQVPARISIPQCRNFLDYDWYQLSAVEKRRFSSTAQSTPRYAGPSTPAKSVGGVHQVLSRGAKNYMSNTESFEAKLRSQSLPKQRPENGSGPRDRIPLSEMMVESRASLSGVGMERSCSKIQDAFTFKRGVGRDAERESYLQRKW